MEAAQPICIAFSNTDVSKSEVLISSNAIGVTGGNEGIITIPRFAGDWGVYRIVFFDKGLSVNAIVWFWVNSKSVSSIQKIKTQQNQICTFNVKEHDFLIVTFSADNASKSSCYICTINNKGSLLIVIDKNQVDDGYKIESISCDKFVLTIKTSVFGGSLKVITI